MSDETPVPIILPDTVVCRETDMLSTELDGETVILSVEKGNYYKLDRIGTHIWKMLEQPIPVGELVEILITEFEVDRETCMADVVAFLENLHRESLAAVPCDERPAPDDGLPPTTVSGDGA